MHDFFHSGWFTFWLILIVIGFVVKQAVDNAKRAAGRVINAVSNNPVASGVAKGTFTYFLHRLFR